MPVPDIGIVTDEISYDLEEAFTAGRKWGLRHFELRVGSEGRIPNFSQAEIRIVDEVVRDGCQITAVSPGILKGAVDNEDQSQRELEEELPRTLELADRFGCEKVIIFGFERYDGEPESNRSRAKETLHAAAEQAVEAGKEVVVENEPGFWVNLPKDEARLLDEIGHPALGANWDPANAARGGYIVDRSDCEAIAPHLRNLHVKDRDAGGDAPRKILGRGAVPWTEILSWVVAETDLDHVTLEPNVAPDPERARRSLEAARALLRPE